MVIKESVKANISLKAHPTGLKKNLEMSLKSIENKAKIEGAKTVLVIGGSSGYGLASRLVAATKLNATTINVCYETAPRKKRTGSAGYWNNIHFNSIVENKNYDFNCDGFSDEAKEDLVKFINENNLKIDLVVYSMAAGARPRGEEVVVSSLKPIGKDVTGRTIDIASNTIREINIEKAEGNDVENTVYVMGGSDWYQWIKTLSEANCLADNAKTFSYTYIGGKTTADIYRDGCIGMAKLDLEATVDKLNESFNVDAFVVSSKAIASKASVFIPSMPIYAGCLYEVMKKQGTHETTTEHVYRLFVDMIYGENAVKDEQGRIRLDALELEEETQAKTIDLMENLSNEELLNLDGMKDFITEFYQINGFRVDGVDYEEEFNFE